MPARCTGLPSSVKPSAPASRSSAISVSASPARPRVTAARKPTGTRASRRACSRSEQQHRRRVDDRVGVRHRHDRDVAAGRRGAGAGVDVLLVLLPGRAQVHVRVDEAGEQVPPLAVDHLGAAGVAASRARRARRSRRRARARRAARRSPCAGRARGRRGPAGRRAASAASRASRRHRGVAEPSRSPLRRAAPGEHSYSTAIRTTTPAATCWPMIACGESITSAASSTPRLTGPGCMSTWREPSRRPSIW